MRYKAVRLERAALLDCGADYPASGRIFFISQKSTSHFPDVWKDTGSIQAEIIKRESTSITQYQGGNLPV
ncbi:MAG: hypothetical protein K1W22_07250 [Lachnospiraceae bacterium]